MNHVKITILKPLDININILHGKTLYFLISKNNNEIFFSFSKCLAKCFGFVGHWEGLWGHAWVLGPYFKEHWSKKLPI